MMTDMIKNSPRWTKWKSPVEEQHFQYHFLYQYIYVNDLVFGKILKIQKRRTL